MILDYKDEFRTNALIEHNIGNSFMEECKVNLSMRLNQS